MDAIKINNIRLSAEFMQYLDSCTSYAAGVEGETDALRKSNVVTMLSLLSDEVDVCEFNPHNFGIGHNELRYFSVDAEGKPKFESNNTRTPEGGEDAFMTFAWEELTDYEKPAIEDILKQIVKQKLVA